MSNEIAALEVDVKEFKVQLETVAASLQADSDNAELQSLKADLEDAISVTQSAIDDMKQALAPQSAAPQQSAPPANSSLTEKWSRENHPAFQAGYKRSTTATSSTPVEDQPVQSTINFKVNDTVLAKWISGDKGFYPARITSVTGSSADPVYLVTFKNYNNSETLRSHDIKPISNDSKKRKADGSPAATSASLAVASTPPLPSDGPSNSSKIISAAANINPDLATQVKREPSKVGDGPTRPPKAPRKVKANKELEAGKTKWQDFNAKGKMSKVSKKESMFRTGEGVTARVGFTGSGQAMRKDPTRSRHIYQPTEDDY